MIRKPYYSPCKLNENHPHADSLVLAYLFNDKTGNLSTDFSKNKTDLSLVNISKIANGIKSDAIGEYGLISNTGNKIINSNCGTMIIYLKSLITFVSGQEQGIFGNNSGVSGSFFILKTSNNRLYLLFYDNVGNHDIYINSGLNAWNSGLQIAFQWDINNSIHSNFNIAININGDYITPGEGRNATSWNSFTVNSNLRMLGIDTNPTRFGNAEIYHSYFYNKVLSALELKSIYEKPYAMFNKSNILYHFLGAFAPTVISTKKQKYFGANALPIGIGL